MFSNIELNINIQCKWSCTQNCVHYGEGKGRIFLIELLQNSSTSRVGVNFLHTL